MNNRNKRYTREFKEEAVRLLLTGTRSPVELARELGISDWACFEILET